MDINKRLDELDVLRGFAVLVMILVTSPGSWSYTYSQLQHASWHGWTFADFVFPDFLFGVGMALGLTFGKSLDPASSPKAFWTRVFRRVIGLVLLGLALNGLYYASTLLGAPPVGPDDAAHFRIPGILQRIAFAYLIAVLVMWSLSVGLDKGDVRIRTFAIAVVIVMFLLGYWAMLTFIPVPGGVSGDLSIAGNLAGYVDRQVFGTQHMWPLGAETWRGPVFYDPEGILATLPASTNVLFGVIAISIWQSGTSLRMALLVGLGTALIAVALLLDPVFPINKKIWTSTFAMLTSGLSCLAFVCVAALIRSQLKPLLWPLKVLGANAILAFSLSIALAAFSSVPFSLGDEPTALMQRGFVITSWLIEDPYLASLAYAFTVATFVLLLLVPLHRKGIHLRL